MIRSPDVPLARPLTLAALALALLASPAARAAGAPPAHRRSSRHSAPTGATLRPMLGFQTDLRASPPTAFWGSAFVFGADYSIPMGGGLYVVPGLHLGAGQQVFSFTPVFDVEYRFHFSKAPALSPYIGGGASLRMAPYLGRFYMALTFRLVLGCDVWLPAGFGLGLQLVLPDIGPLLTPYVTPVGAVDLTFGPRFKF